MTSKIYLIRHGITEGNVKRWFYGSTDLSLIEEGRQALAKLAAEGYYPKLPKGAKLYTTGLKRTEETMEVIYGNKGTGLLTDLREMNFGEYECHSFKELEKDEIFIRWMEDQSGDMALPGGESKNQFAERVKQGMKWLLEDCSAGLSEESGPESQVAFVVCHGGVIAEALDQLFPEEKENMWQWMPHPGYGYEVLVEDGRPLEARPL